jgi:aspartyl-tRNA(Asn)/glutamyl-tRNA(Gln) amidotransferase subunit B
MTARDYEPVIGMEIHAELRTRSKMFCGCAVADTTAAEPNTHICPVCTGLPGAMPVANRAAIEQAILVGLALNCRINERAVFARKNYFYPDLPKGYQISQYDHPIASDGWLAISEGDGQTRRIGVRRAHLEEDTAKLFHVHGSDGAAHTLIDFNRSGVPLLEIVSEPEMHSAETAVAYGNQIRQILRYLRVNSGDMEKGVLRFEANVSVRRRGAEQLGTRTEIKNLNSFRAMAQAIDYEIRRQIAVLERGGTVVQETRGWDESRGATFVQRGKEEAHDYRYFPEPDLPPLQIDRAWVDEVRAALPELPAAREQRFVTTYGLPRHDARLLAAERARADYFDAAVAAYDGDPTEVSKWIVGELFHLLHAKEMSIEEARVTPEHLTALIALVDNGTLNQPTAREVLATVFESGEPPREIVAARGLTQIDDAETLAALIAELLTEHPDQVRAYRAGKEGLRHWFVGQVMRATRGRADPDLTQQLLVEALDKTPQPT